MKLGKIQKAWIKSLKEHPERQTEKVLGFKEGNSYKACCLGELLITACRVHKKKIPLIEGRLLDQGNSRILESYEKYGLRSCDGFLGKAYTLINKEGKEITESGLASFNDRGVSWSTIADFIEMNPSAVFIKSV